jgi:hypothetical protein
MTTVQEVCRTFFFLTSMSIASCVFFLTSIGILALFPILALGPNPNPNPDPQSDSPGPYQLVSCWTPAEVADRKCRARTAAAEAFHGLVPATVRAGPESLAQPIQNPKPSPDPTINHLFTSFYFLRNGYTG